MIKDERTAVAGQVSLALTILVRPLGSSSTVKRKAESPSDSMPCRYFVRPVMQQAIIVRSSIGLASAQALVAATIVFFDYLLVSSQEITSVMAHFSKHFDS